MKKRMFGTALLMLIALGGLLAQEPPQNVYAEGNTSAMIITWDAPQGAPANVAYLVWRLFPGQEVDPSTWTCLTPNVILNNAITDNDWFHLPHLEYKWAVKAVYPGTIVSAPAYSNSVYVPLLFCTLTGIVRNSSGQAIPNATVACENNSVTTDGSGSYALYTYPGTHVVSASHPEYAQASTSVSLYNQIPYTLNFTLHGYANTFHDSFESYPDFSLDFSPWITDDVDLSETYGLGGYDWQNEGEPQAFIVFNPSATTPPLTNIMPHSGNKMLACFSAVNPPNRDWLISPLISNPLEIRFFARSYSAANGLERFRVGVSQGQTVPATFTLLTQDWIEVPETWTQYTFDLSEYYGLEVRIGIVCGSSENTALFLDDVVIEPNGAGDDPLSPDVAAQLKANYPNPFTTCTTLSYSLRENASVAIEIFDLRGQRVRTLFREEMPKGEHELSWDGLDDHGKPVSTGIYLCRLSAGKQSSTRKLLKLR